MRGRARARDGPEARTELSDLLLSDAAPEWSAARLREHRAAHGGAWTPPVAGGTGPAPPPAAGSKGKPPATR